VAPKFSLFLAFELSFLGLCKRQSVKSKSEYAGLTHFMTTELLKCYEDHIPVRLSTCRQ
jgi:hypothetical protein